VLLDPVPAHRFDTIPGHPFVAQHICIVCAADVQVLPGAWLDKAIAAGLASVSAPVAALVRDTGEAASCSRRPAWAR
jgi:hypothetical protein